MQFTAMDVMCCHGTTSQSLLVGDLMQSLNEISLNGPLLICFDLYVLGLQFHRYQTSTSVSFHVLKFLSLFLLLEIIGFFLFDIPLLILTRCVTVF